jgi:O-antigen/teichoic acid export membrane protein
MDAVLQQAMLAREAVAPAIRHSALGVLAQGALLVLLSQLVGLQGASVAVLLAAAATLAMDLRHVVAGAAQESHEAGQKCSRLTPDAYAPSS